MDKSLDNNFANHIGYSDIDPYEVVNKVSDITIEIRAMDAEQTNGKDMEFVPGGFSHICVNGPSQKWNITSNADNPVIRIRYSKAKNRWQCKGGRVFKLSSKPTKYYDFNF